MEDPYGDCEEVLPEVEELGQGQQEPEVQESVEMSHEGVGDDKQGCAEREYWDLCDDDEDEAGLAEVGQADGGDLGAADGGFEAELNWQQQQQQQHFHQAGPITGRPPSTEAGEFSMASW